METLFTAIGGTFITPYLNLKEKAQNLRAIIFDWDGVFNSGVKGEGVNSPYYEADSMGINLLRFGYWLTNREIPLTSIISGENNISAYNLATREHFKSVYFSIKNKATALEHLRTLYGINSEQVAYIFDDVLDLQIASQCGLRFLIKREASAIFNDYVKHNNYCDYITASQGGNFAIREICELLISLNYNFNDIIEERINSTFNYEEYLKERNSLDTNFYTLEEGSIIRKDPQ
ncbi:MAG: hypothetical protein KA792_08670 [Bacteroidales bacterium]|nr:hypothetical protein [Bacteroidales bacterium]